MVPVKTRPKLRRVTLVVLLFCALSVAILLSLLQQKRDKIQMAEAQARLGAAQRNLQAAMHVVTTAEALLAADGRNELVIHSDGSFAR
jgi:type II secretory pathway pseudopilin PulG